jgi:hypothetical protein
VHEFEYLHLPTARELDNFIINNMRHHPHFLPPEPPTKLRGTVGRWSNQIDVSAVKADPDYDYFFDVFDFTVVNIYLNLLIDF